jgi:outer membrane protein assembly factor BamA
MERKALLLTNSISYVRDNTLWSSTGPIDGNRLNFTLSYTTDVQYSNVNYFTAIADYRRYFRLSDRMTLAARAALFYNDGREARRYFLGGSWDLRGYRWLSLRGTKVWVASTELRFPLIESIALRMPFGWTLGFAGFRGALFFDAGNAWDQTYGSTNGSIGAGVRLNVLGALVLRYDVGKRIEEDFTKFSDGLYSQIFFGWDF